MSKTTATELSVGELEARIELSVGELKALATALYEHVMLGCPTWSKPSPPADAKEEANRALMSAYGKIWELDWIEANRAITIRAAVTAQNRSRSIADGERTNRNFTTGKSHESQLEDRNNRRRPPPGD